MAYGVIGNTPVFGTDIQGSSPCRPTKNVLIIIIKTFLFLLGYTSFNASITFLLFPMKILSSIIKTGRFKKVYSSKMY